MDTNPTNQIQIFNNPQFGEVRVTVAENGEPMFCLADVCKALDLTNTSMVKSRLSTKGPRDIRPLPGFQCSDTDSFQGWRDHQPTVRLDAGIPVGREGRKTFETMKAIII